MVKTSSRYIILIYLSLHFLSLSGQTSPYLLVKWTPTALADPQTPVAHFGIEFRPAKHWGIELGYGIPVYGITRAKYEQHRFSKWRAELRYYLLSEDSHRFYVAAEGFYIPRRYLKRNQQYEAADGQVYDYEESLIRRNVVGAAVKWGIAMRVGSWFFVETYGGLGIRSRTIQHSPLNATLGEAPSFYEWFGPGADFTEGHKNLLHISFGVKLCAAVFGK